MADELQRHIARVARAVAQGQSRFTLHAAQQRRARGISRQEIETATKRGEIIEFYPNYRYGPCCLIFGSTIHGRSMHVLCSLRDIVDIITVYEPNTIEDLLKNDDAAEMRTVPVYRFPKAS